MKKNFVFLIALCLLLCLDSCVNHELTYRRYDLDSIETFSILGLKSIDVSLRLGDSTCVEVYQAANDRITHRVDNQISYTVVFKSCKESKVVITAPSYRDISVLGKVNIHSEEPLCGDTIWLSLISYNNSNIAVDANYVDLMYETALFNSKCVLSGKTNQIQVLPVGLIGWCDISALSYDSLDTIDLPIWHRLKKK